MITKKDIDQIMEIVEDVVSDHIDYETRVASIINVIRTELEEMRTQNKKKK